MIGDQQSDRAAAVRAGIPVGRTLLVADGDDGSEVAAAVSAAFGST
jgi:hypothetical protein